MGSNHSAPLVQQTEVTMTSVNRRVILVKRPTVDATPDCFLVEDEALEPLAEGQMRVAVDYITGKWPLGASYSLAASGGSSNQQCLNGQWVRPFEGGSARRLWQR
jgi:hypothetical protein